MKETDRITAVVTELQRAGIHAVEHADGLTIHPGQPKPCDIHTYDDHRMAMCFAMLGLRIPGMRLRNPRWAAYHVRDLPRIPVPKPRPEKFEADRRTASRVGSESYSGSGYDRGHMAPNYAIATRHGEAAQRETFLMSNITPQRHALNAGLWRELETRIATSWPARYGEVWVIVGPVFGEKPRTLRGGVAVPEAFFMIIIDEQDGRLRTLAFLVPQETPEGADPARHLTTIDEIERRTGLDFLPELDAEAQRAIESQRAARVW